jgi:death-on-curing protein
MKRLSGETVIAMHSELIAQSGGLDGIRDTVMLDASINSPFHTFDGQNLYPTIQAMAAHLAFSLINNLALKGEVCCFGKVFVSGFNTFLTALKGGVLNPSHTIKNHAFIDGNKRIGILSMLVFLDINGLPVDCTDDELVTLGLGLADSSINRIIHCPKASFDV